MCVLRGSKTKEYHVDIALIIGKPSTGPVDVGLHSKKFIRIGRERIRDLTIIDKALEFPYVW